MTDTHRTATEMEESCAIPQTFLPPAELTDDLAALIERGVDERWVRQLGHAPEAFVAWTRFYWPMLFGGRVEVRTKEVARLRIAALNTWHY